MNDISISSLVILTIGGTWQKTLDLVPQGGTLSITTTPTHYLMKRSATTNVAISYVTGSPSFSGSQITTGEVGTGSIPPGRYTYFLTVPTSAGTYVLYQDFEFKAMIGH